MIFIISEFRQKHEVYVKINVRLWYSNVKLSYILTFFVYFYANNYNIQTVNSQPSSKGVSTMIYEYNSNKIKIRHLPDATIAEKAVYAIRDNGLTSTQDALTLLNIDITSTDATKVLRDSKVRNAIQRNKLSMKNHALSKLAKSDSPHAQTTLLKLSANREELERIHSRPIELLSESQRQNKERIEERKQDLLDNPDKYKKEIKPATFNDNSPEMKLKLIRTSLQILLENSIDFELPKEGIKVKVDGKTYILNAKKPTVEKANPTEDEVPIFNDYENPTLDDCFEPTEPTGTNITDMSKDDRIAHFKDQLLNGLLDKS